MFLIDEKNRLALDRVKFKSAQSVHSAVKGLNTSPVEYEIKEKKIKMQKKIISNGKINESESVCNHKSD